MSQQPGGTRQLSFAQQRLWFLDQLLDGSTDYLLPMALRIRGDLDTEALLRALEAVVDRHQVLRTRYPAFDGEPAPQVVGTVVGGCRREDFSALGPDAAQRQLDRLLAQELSTGMDLSVDGPFRAALVRLAADEHVLVVVVHHIAFDGWSWGVLCRELADGYRQRTEGIPSQLAPLPMQYADYAEMQREQLTDAKRDRQLDYWRSQLAGLAPLTLPTDRPRPQVWNGAGDVIRFDIPAETVAAVDSLARNNRCTRFMVLLTVFEALLARCSGQTDIAIGTPVSGRGLPATQQLVGLFLNTVVLRSAIGMSKPFAEVLTEVRDTTLAAFGNAELPFEQIANELVQERDLSRNPLFQVSFSLRTASSAALTLPGLDVRLAQTPMPGTPFDIFLGLDAGADGALRARLQYATALFDEQSMQQLAECYLQLLSAVLASPQASVAELVKPLPPLPGAERKRLLAIGNQTAAEFPDVPFIDLVADQVRATPDAVAVESDAGSLTYAELDARSNQLAHHLRDLGAGPGRMVGLVVDRSLNLLITMLATVKAGAAYLPIDPSLPAERIRFMLDDADAQLVVTSSELLAPWAENRASVLLDRDQDQIAGRPSEGLGRTCTPEDPAYVIYTSGSTGVPKGVLIHHRALTNFLASMQRRLAVQPTDAIAALTTVSFDPSVLELYLPLLVGARLVLGSAEQSRDPQRIGDLLTRYRPAVLQATPVMLRMLLDVGWVGYPGLRVLAGGEKLTADLASRLAGNGAEVWDIYGPTETTLWTTTTRMARNGSVADCVVLGNYTCYLLDGQREPVGDGEIGELYIGGASVARGYYGRPGLTAERFVPDPFGARAGARLYQTGDLARRRPDGSIEILGRADHQVKIRGHRMEPAEIEVALVAHPDVRAAVVHPTPAPDGEWQLTAYLIPTGQAVPPTEQLRELLLRTLPDYMVPNAFVELAEFPLTASGKVDRKALPQPAPVTTRIEQAPARTAEERAVVEVWQEVLGRADIGVHDDFFDLGGHSLLATRVAVRLRAMLGIDVPVRSLFDHSTVSKLAAGLADYPRLTGTTSSPALVTRRRTVRHEGRPEYRTAPSHGTGAYAIQLHSQEDAT